MTQDRDFQQFGFAQYSQPRRAQAQRSGLLARVFGPAIATKLSSPIIATAAFVVVGAGLAGIILVSYPSSSDEQALPVVKADTLAYKEAPSEPGGMAIDNRDNTIFMSMRGDAAAEGAPIENLLSDDEAALKLEEFAQQVEAVSEDGDVSAAVVQGGVSDSVAKNVPGEIENLLEDEAVVVFDSAKNTKDNAVVVIPDPVAPSAAVSAPKDSLASAAPTTKPVMVHKPGSNPETLDFVRSVLDKKDGRVAVAARATRQHDVSDAASQAASVQPAAGMAIAAGSHYVQLGSVKSMSGAEGEWSKLQKRFSELSGVSHRVKSADLGERGTFYRIQAGPMSRDSAGALCDSIKAQKPGGCLVIQ